MLEQHYGHTINRMMADELTKHKAQRKETREISLGTMTSIFKS